MSDKERWVLAWFTKADHDLKAAKAILGSAEPPYDMVCFHAQQCAEKMLKGFLTLHGKEIRKTHDLVHLLIRCSEIEGDFSKWEETCEKLTDYSVDSRYPPDMLDEPAIFEEEARKALEYAENFRKFVAAKTHISIET